MSKNKLDLVLCNIPFMSVAYAPAGTSLLKACLQEAGFSCTVKDYNIKLWHSLSDKKIIADLENLFYSEHHARHRNTNFG